jgi:hypothetical protein
MGLYRVTYASTASCPADETASHVERLGLTGPEGPNTVDVEVARLLLSAGDTLTVGARGDEAAELRKAQCPACGAPTLDMGAQRAEGLASLRAC